MDRGAITALIGGGVFLVLFGVLAVTASVNPDTAPVPVTATAVFLPACDDAGPGEPVRGSCVMFDDMTVTLKPFPFALTGGVPLVECRPAVTRLCYVEGPWAETRQVQVWL